MFIHICGKDKSAVGKGFEKFSTFLHIYRALGFAHPATGIFERLFGAGKPFFSLDPVGSFLFLFFYKKMKMNKI